jgi:hypothetical protein
VRELKRARGRAELKLHVESGIVLVFHLKSIKTLSGLRYTGLLYSSLIPIGSGFAAA